MIDYDNIKKTEKWLKKRSQILDVQKNKNSIFQDYFAQPKNGHYSKNRKNSLCFMCMVTNI